MKIETKSTLQKHLKSGDNMKILEEFFSLLAVCHTVLPEHQEGSKVALNSCFS